MSITTQQSSIKDSEASQLKDVSSDVYNTLAESFRLKARRHSLQNGPDSSRLRTFLRILAATFPWVLLLFQLLWCAALQGLTYWLDTPDRLDASDVTGRMPVISLSSAIVMAASFSLFVLLSFAVREGTSRHREAIAALYSTAHSLRHLARKAFLHFPPSNWHEGDQQRIVAHLAAFIIAVGESVQYRRDPSAYENLVHSDDAADFVNASIPFVRVAVTLRAYFNAAKDTPITIGAGSNFQVVSLVDAAESSARDALRLKRSHVAIGYSIHLRVFTYLWAALLPVAMLSESGWWTLLFAPAATFPVATLLNIASALSKPFQPSSLLSVPADSLCASFAAEIFSDAAASPSFDIALSKDNETYDQENWLDRPLPPDVRGVSPHERLVPSPWRAFKRSITTHAVAFLFLATLWTAAIVFLTWGLSRLRTRVGLPFREDGDRWWSGQVPITTQTTGFLTLAFFLLLTFWATDGAARFAAALDLWQARLATNLDAFAHLISQMIPQDFCHKGDHRRLLSHVAVLPYTMKAHLRGSRDVSVLRELLSENDVQHFIDDKRPFPIHCLDTIYAYIDSIDDEFKDFKKPFFGTTFAMQNTLLEADRALWESAVLKSTKISPAFTYNLILFAAVWIMLLPMTIVQTDGFLTFLYMIPIAFSTINIIQVGLALSNPFGCDEEDVPLDAFCDDIKNSVHRIYQATRGGTRNTIHTDENYSRDTFSPNFEHWEPLKDDIGIGLSRTIDPEKHSFRRQLLDLFASLRQVVSRGLGSSKGNPFLSGDLPTVRERIYEPTLLGLLTKKLASVPTISLKAYLVVTAWAVASVYISWGFGRFWKGEDRGDCASWCSPVEVQGNVLANVGFALFMILSFRTTNSVIRYENGARILYALRQELRGLTLDFVHSFPTGFFHSGDKERIVAHIAQIPLCVRDMLRFGNSGRASAREGLLSDGDFQRFQDCVNPFEHLVETLEDYIFLQDSTLRTGWNLDKFRAPPGVTGPILGRLLAIRQNVSRASVIKRFPIVESYRRHEGMFAALWLFMLPLSMASQTGFFTIMWAPLISYGVLVLRDIAAQLVDPFGHDPDDLPVQALCLEASNSVLDAVRTSGWDTDKLCESITTSNKCAPNAIGTVLHDTEVSARLVLAKVDDSSLRGFDAQSVRRARHTLFTHLIESSPWRILGLGFIWAVAACTFSAAVRTNRLNNAWWRDTTLITTDVLNGVSFGAFTLLGFFVARAAARYQEAGVIWVQRIRPACHSLVSNLLRYYRDGAVHTDDIHRMIGIVASIPLAVKAELRGTRDVRDVAGLLSAEDMTGVVCSENICNHLFDTVRAYFLRITLYPDKLIVKDISTPRLRTALIRIPLIEIENALADARFLMGFDVSPAFRTLLGALLFIWFAILPFLLFEVSGWLTLFWMPVIMFGIVGIYSVANELRLPYGHSVNALDLDGLSYALTADVLQTAMFQQPSFKILHSHKHSPSEWSDQLLSPTWQLSKGEKPQSMWDRLRTGFGFALTAVPMWQLGLLLLWSTTVFFVAFGITRRFSSAMGCSGKWFCRLGSVNADVKTLVGVALFLLLGSQVNDAHSRYVRAQSVWLSGVNGNVFMLANRLIQAVKPGLFHEGDVSRIAGLTAAIPPTLASLLRHGGVKGKESLQRNLSEMLTESDVEGVLRASNPLGHIFDILRSYMFYTETIFDVREEGVGITFEEIFNIYFIIDRIQVAAAECVEISKISPPFGYRVHISVLLAVWLFILPIGVVEESGWLAVLWSMLIGYGVLGVLRWADELVDPFGCDKLDLPVNEYAIEGTDGVREVLGMFPNGSESIIRNGPFRPSLQSSDASSSIVAASFVEPQPDSEAKRI